MKTSLISVSLVSMAAITQALALPKFSTRQANCDIVAPQLVSFTLADLYGGSFSAQDVQNTTTFLTDNTYGTGAIFDFDASVSEPGPCSVRFYFPDAEAFSVVGSSQINAYSLPPGDTNVSDAYLLGTTTFSQDDSTYPKYVEVNSPACPANGELLVAFVNTDASSSITFDQSYDSGLFLFRGDCYGPPNFSKVKA